MKHEMLVVAGRRGRGKTAFAVTEAIYTARKGKTVWANFPLDFRHLNLKGKCYFAEELADIADMRDGLFIVDEAHYLASGRWKSLDRDTHALISLSRHLRMRIIFISQNFRRLDPIIRELADGVLILHRLWRYTYGKHWCADDINDEGRPKEKARSYDKSSFWHTKGIHKCYDDEDLILEMLRNRQARTWQENGVGFRPSTDERREAATSQPSHAPPMPALAADGRRRPACGH